MAIDYRFKFPLPNGLHARPASHFEAVTNRFRSAITLVHERTLYRANARSVLSMVSADVKFDDLCCIHVDGEDEQPAIDAVRRFLEYELPHCDQPLPEVIVDHQAAPVSLPRSLLAAGLQDYLRGKAVCAGVGLGKAQVVDALPMPRGFENEITKGAEYEIARATAAVDAVAAAINGRIGNSARSQEVEVLKAHASIVRDVDLWDMVTKLIVTQHRTAAQAIAAACESFSETFRKSQNTYLRERVLDIEDICIQLLHHVVGDKGYTENGRHNGSHAGNGSAGRTGHKSHGKTNSNEKGPTEPWICVANHLTPGQFLGLDHKSLRGLVLSEGGATSHTVILARSMNIPTLVGVPASAAVVNGQELLLDGNLGILITKTPKAVRRYYQMEQDCIERSRQQLESFRHVAGMTADQHPVEVGANIASADEAAVAFHSGAQGIGLFRTEMLFMDRAEAPSEQDQTRIYSAAVQAAKDRPVIIRLLDIGGDKPAPYLKFAAEENPFLGYRGSRLYEEFSQLVKTQLRSILRASADGGNIRILVPMVCCMEEVYLIKQMLAEAADELQSLGLTIAKMPPLGVMIEVPSMAFIMPELCQELDFFSVGSNDLLQYFFAADRANEKVSHLYKWSQPSFLRLLKTIVDQAHQHKKWIGLCGEMGDDPAALPLLVGLGFDEISVSAPRVALMKAAIGKVNFTRCQQLLTEATMTFTRQALESFLQEAQSQATDAPLLNRELITQLDVMTKEEVIKQLGDQLFLAGRATSSQLLEEAIWNREDTYSTGFGHGFALPHCKSDHLTSNSIVVAKLTNPVEWGSLDSKPVDVVLLLAVRAKEHAQAHMKIFARLSRLVMRDEFRDRIRSETDVDQLTVFLKQSLGLEDFVTS